MILSFHSSTFPKTEVGLQNLSFLWIDCSFTGSHSSATLMEAVAAALPPLRIWSTTPGPTQARSPLSAPMKAAAGHSRLLATSSITTAPTAARSYSPVHTLTVAGYSPGQHTSSTTPRPIRATGHLGALLPAATRASTCCSGWMSTPECILANGPSHVLSTTAWSLLRRPAT